MTLFGMDVQVIEGLGSWMMISAVQGGIMVLTQGSGGPKFISDERIAEIARDAYASLCGASGQGDKA